MNNIIANWKMDLDLNKGVDLAKEFKDLIEKEKENLKNTNVALCPPFTHLFSLSKILSDSKVSLGAQNMFWESKGDFTGEISPKWLKDLSCKYVILGHSERRRFLNEDYSQ